MVNSVQNTQLDLNQVSQGEKIKKSQDMETSFLDMAKQRQSESVYATENVAEVSEVSSISSRMNEILYSGGNNYGASYDMSYAYTSSSANPQMYVEGVDEQGNNFFQIIDINSIDIFNCTVLEMKAFEMHMLELNMGNNIERMGGFFPTDEALASMGLGDTMNLMDLFEDPSSSSLDLNFANVGDIDYSSLFSGDSNSYSSLFDSGFDMIMELFQAFGYTDDSSNVMSEIDMLYEQQKILSGFNF